PDQPTPAFVWVLDLDAAGEVVGIDLERALVRSREKLAYDQVQAEPHRGAGHPVMLLLQEIEALRTPLEFRRGGTKLKVPKQEVVANDDQVRRHARRPHPCEDEKDEISLMTGRAAAQVLLSRGAGILPTMPPAEPSAVALFRRQAEALGTLLPPDQAYGA